MFRMRCSCCSACIRKDVTTFSTEFKKKLVDNYSVNWLIPPTIVNQKCQKHFASCLKSENEMLFLVMCITLNFYLTITLNMAVGNSNSLVDIEGNIATAKILLITILARTYNYIICQVIILMHLNTFLNKLSAYFITFLGNFYIIGCLKETWARTAVRFKPPGI